MRGMPLLAVSLSIGSKMSIAKRCVVPRFYLLTNQSDGKVNSMEALHVLKAQKRHSIGLVAATGPSAGLFTSSQAKILQASTDVWGMNQFFLHAHLGESSGTPDITVFVF